MPVALGAWGQEEVAVDDCVGDLDDLLVVPPGVGTERFERGLLIDAVALHQDAFGALDHRSPTEGAFQPMVFAEAKQHDLERALQRSVIRVDDVREYARFAASWTNAVSVADRTAITGHSASATIVEIN